MGQKIKTRIYFYEIRFIQNVQLTQLEFPSQYNAQDGIL